MATGLHYPRCSLLALTIYMHRRILQSLLLACILTGALSAQPRLIRGSIQDARRTRMADHVHPRVKLETDLGPMDPAETLPAITLVLRPTAEQQADLDQFLAAQQDPASPDYHRWLTPEQYADRFGASTDDIAKIVAWLEQHNLHVASTAEAGLRSASPVPWAISKVRSRSASIATEPTA